MSRGAESQQAANLTSGLSVKHLSRLIILPCLVGPVGGLKGGGGGGGLGYWRGGRLGMEAEEPCEKVTCVKSMALRLFK